MIKLHTNHGVIGLELDAEKAPQTVANFIAYAQAGHYDGTVFHRVIKNFMIQGGGFEPGMKEKKTREPIRNESGNGLSNKRGTIAMARRNDLDSATSQFFINVVDNGPLDAGRYAVFGKVIDGMDVVDKIRKVETAKRGFHGDVPVKDVLIESVRRADK